MSAADFSESLRVHGPKLENLLKRRFFVAPSFEIYGSASGLFDFGPNGCGVKNELESLWRRHFVLEEDLMEICGPNLTPHNVLKTSGHVDRFQDFMCEDVVTKDCYRTDKILDEFLTTLRDALTQILSARSAGQRFAPNKNTPAFVLKLVDESSDILEAKLREIDLCVTKLEGMTADELSAVVATYEVRSPAGNELSRSYPFNLMFATRIGPKQQGAVETSVAYLRPETAQGIFVNFRRLLEQNAGKMPFGAACVGTSFRNEIAPRNGLLRVREFPMAEIEYFCDPSAKSPFAKFGRVAHLEVPLFDRATQLDPACQQAPLRRLGDAVQQGIIDNETLAYFIGRTYLFLSQCGIRPEGLRFRQHLATEMAHYASDCWDAEILTSYKWIECVGIADRSAYDLTQHAKATRVDLNASRVLKEKRIVRSLVAKLEKKIMGPVYKKELQNVCQVFEELTQQELAALQRELAETGNATIAVPGADGSKASLTVPAKFVSIEEQTITQTEESYTPNVIEPSFGVGRILHAIFEHSFRMRDEERTYLALPPVIAPIKCSILPLSGCPDFIPVVESLRSEFLLKQLSVKVDTGNVSIGKRYARTDEIGIPFGVTVDFQTLSDATVTLREMNSMEQVRLPAGEVAELVRKLVKSEVHWQKVLEAYPRFTQQQQPQQY